MSRASVRPGIIADFPIPFSTFAPPKHAGGRPTKCTDELLTQLECLVALTPIGKKHLCTLLGIAHQTCLNWERQGQADRGTGEETPHTQFLDLFEKGQAYWRIRLMNAQLTGDKTWAKYATALERLWPDEFGKRNEDGSGPKVFVQIGVRDSDVQVQVNAIDTYQTQKISECVTTQLLAASPLDGFALESGERNLDDQAKGRKGDDAL